MDNEQLKYVLNILNDKAEDNRRNIELAFGLLRMMPDKKEEEKQKIYKDLTKIINNL